MKVMFVNHYNNGDIHLSREFVRKIINKVHQKDPMVLFSYSHRNPKNLLADISNLEFNPQAFNNIKDYENLKQIGDTIYINTWYAQQHHKYIKQYGITFDCLYAIFDDTCKQLWGFSLNEISIDPILFFPKIDYSKFEINDAKNWLTAHPEKKILIENGNALSGQANNFPITPIILNIADKYPNYTFILTNIDPTISLPPNVFYSSNIINKQIRSDLNEVSFLSSYCDIIIGRASGVFTFSFTQHNLFARHIKYLCFSNLIPKIPDKFWLGPLFQDVIYYASTIFVSNEDNLGNIRHIIEDNLD